MQHVKSFFSLAVLGATVGALLFVGGLDAQELERDMGALTIEGRSGAAVPAGDLADQVDAGFAAGLALGFDVTPRVTLGVEGDGSFMSQIDAAELGDQVEPFFATDGLNLWSYGGQIDVDLTDPELSEWTVLLSGGAGATTIDPQERALPEDVQGAGNETRFNASAGLGVGYAVTDQVDLMVDARARSIFLDDDDFETDTIEQTVEEDLVGENWWNFPLQARVRVALP